MKRQEHNGRHDHDEQTREANRRRTSGNRDSGDSQKDYSNYGSEYDDQWEGQPRGNRNEDWQSEQGRRGNENGNWGSWNQDHEWRGNRDGNTRQGYGNGSNIDNQGEYDRQRYSNRDNRNERTDYDAPGNYGNQSYYGTSGNHGNQANYGNQRGYTNRDFDSNRTQENRYGQQDWNRDANERGQSMHKGVGPKGYQRSDERIKEDVNDRLTDDGMLNASEIEVEVKAGEVVLSGTVENRNEKRRAEDVAEAVSGVKNVENRIRVSQGNMGNRQGNTEDKNSTQQAQKQNKTS